MKKIRILFAVIMLIAIVTTPAHADFFYLYNDTLTADTVKVAPMLYPGFAMYDYPKEFKSFNASVMPCLKTFSYNNNNNTTIAYMFISSWNGSKQVATLFPYQYSAWGMSDNRLDDIELADSGQYACDLATVTFTEGEEQTSTTEFYMIDMGADKANGSLTIYKPVIEEDETYISGFTKLGKIEFNAASLGLTADKVVHPEVVFEYNGKAYILLSVQNNDGTWGNKNWLISIDEDDTGYKIDDKIQLNTKADAYGSIKPYVENVANTGYILLAADKTIEKVTLNTDSGTPETTALVTAGVDIVDWGGKFIDIVSDSSNTYVLAKITEEENYTYIVFKIATETLLAKDEETGEYIGILPDDKLLGPISSEDTDLPGEPFLLPDLSYAGRTWISLGETGKIYRCDSGTVTVQQPVIGDMDYFCYAVPSLTMSNPSDTQIPDNGGGCNAGATAAMLVFCAVPFLFKKKH